MINLTPTDLMLQAMDTSEGYLKRAIRSIDQELGENFAKTHPQLVGDFMKTAAMDFDTTMTRQALDYLSNDWDRLATAAENIAVSVSDSEFTKRHKDSDQLQQAALTIAAAIQEFRPLYEDYLAFISRNREL